MGAKKGWICMCEGVLVALILLSTNKNYLKKSFEREWIVCDTGANLDWILQIAFKERTTNSEILNL